MMAWKQRIPTGVQFLFLLPLFFVLHGCAENYPVILFGEAVELLLQYEAIAAVLFGLCWAVLRSVNKAGFYAFFLLGFQLLFGAVHDTLKSWAPNLFISKYLFLIAASAVVLVWLFFYLRRTQISLRKPATYLNVVLLFLILVDVATLGVRAMTLKRELVATTAAQGLARRPNIYLIILDEYAGPVQLKDMFGFDNKPYEDSLRARGFQVLSKTSSNYNYTPYSMASLFSMSYVDGINRNSADFGNRKIIFDRINTNRLTRMLTAAGYRFANHSLFDFAGLPPLSDHVEFYLTGKRIISSQTFTSRVKRDLWYHAILNLDLKWAQAGYLNTLKDDIAEAYTKTVEESRKPTAQPRFVYSHFVMPHYPYLYDEQGKDVPFKTALAPSEASYLAFLKYGNRLSLRLVDEILRNDPSKPIVIVMSDHGYTKYSGDWPQRYNFTNMINVCNAAPLPDSLSNVNLFRHLLNDTFGAGLPMLKDSTIFLD